MLKSILTGGTLGILLSGTAAVGLALLFPAPAGNVSPAMPQMDVPTAIVDPSGDRDVAALDVVTDSPKVEPAPETASVTEVVADPQADTAPLAEPQTSSVDGAMSAPEVPEDLTVTATTEDPVLPNPQSLAPQAPDADTQVAILSTPAEALPQPVIVDEEVVLAPVIIEDAPVEDVQVERADVEDSPEPDADMAPELVDDVASQAEPESEIPVDSNPSAQIVAPAVISIVTEDGEILPRGDGVVQVNRPTTETPQVEANVSDASVDPEATALVRFGAAFDNPDNKNLLSVVLHDRGEMADPSLSLSQFDFPVTIVIDPEADDAKQRMRTYRDAGLEVAVLVDLPVGATPSDIEIILAGVFAELPDAVALIDIGGQGLQADRDVIEQTMAILAEDGRGLLTISRGLNTALRAADEAGVPAATIYRDIDPEWQSARIISRFLDQSAFRARQQSGVVLFGRLRPNTLTALKNWGRSSRAEQIALAPLSAVLAEQATLPE